MTDLNFVYTAFNAFIRMVSTIVNIFTAPLSSLADTPLPDWLDALNAPLIWLIETLEWGNLTLLEVMLVTGLPIFMLVAFVKFFLPTS